jgi:polyisoprenoid-binding protein YceI
METERWEIDSAHSEILFSVRQVGAATVRGRFTRWSASIHVEGGELARGRIDVLIDTSSVDTRDRGINDKLWGTSWLDVESHPEATFKSTRLRVLKGHRLRVGGVLAVRGLEVEVTLDVKLLGRTRDPWGNERVALSGKGALTPASLGVALVLAAIERVELEIQLEAVKQPSCASAAPHPK